MDKRQSITRLVRRLGFGFTGTGLESALSLPVASARSSILGVPSDVGNPFTGLDLQADDGQVRQKAVSAAMTWLDAAASSATPLVERIAWTWHGILVSSIAKVKVPELSVAQIQRFREIGAGPFAELLSAITVDPAMLVYLDGAGSTAAAPNENYGRELLELFSLGVGNYTEADIAAATRALTGYSVNRLGTPPTATLRPRQHDDTRQRFLDAEGVHDVGTVIAAVVARPECATFVASRFLRDIIGPDADPSIRRDLARRFAESGLVTAELLSAAADVLLSDVALPPIISAPVPWYVAALRSTGARPKPLQVAQHLTSAGQLPLTPPNVAGWPSGDEWLNSATVVARLNLAEAVALATPPGSPVLETARRGDWGGLSLALGLPGDLRPATVRGLERVPDGLSRVALALVSPDFVEV